MNKKKKTLIGITALLIAACIFCISYYNIVLLWIDHGLDKPSLLEITLDKKVIFEGTANPPEIMPPIVYSKRLILGGKHTIKFHDKTRGIEEIETFNGSKIRTILIRIRKDILQNKHIIIDPEKIPIK